MYEVFRIHQCVFSQVFMHLKLVFYLEDEVRYSCIGWPACSIAHMMVFIFSSEMNIHLHVFWEFEMIKL